MFVNCRACSIRLSLSTILVFTCRPRVCSKSFDAWSAGSAKLVRSDGGRSEKSHSVKSDMRCRMSSSRNRKRLVMWLTPVSADGSLSALTRPLFSCAIEVSQSLLRPEIHHEWQRLVTELLHSCKTFHSGLAETVSRLVHQEPLMRLRNPSVAPRLHHDMCDAQAL